MIKTLHTEKEVVDALMAMKVVIGITKGNALTIYQLPNRSPSVFDTEVEYSSVDGEDYSRLIMGRFPSSPAYIPFKVKFNANHKASQI